METFGSGLGWSACWDGSHPRHVAGSGASIVDANRSMLAIRWMN